MLSVVLMISGDGNFVDMQGRREGGFQGFRKPPSIFSIQ